MDLRLIWRERENAAFDDRVSISASSTSSLASVKRSKLMDQSIRTGSEFDDILWISDGVHAEVYTSLLQRVREELLYHSDQR